MTQHADIFAALCAPFEPSQIRHRPGGNGRELSYVTARTVANRMDEVLGPENWEDEYIVIGEILYCRITITLPDGRKVSKMDAGGFKTMTAGRGEVDEENTDKTGPTDAFKRAAAKFGVARYLYQDGVPRFAWHLFDGGQPAPRQEAPARPAQQPRDDGPPQQAPPRQGQAPPSSGSGGKTYGPPTKGNALFAWAKSEQARTTVDFDIVKALDEFGRANGYPYKMIDWDREQVETAWTEAKRRIEMGKLAKKGQAPAGFDATYAEDEEIPF